MDAIPCPIDNEDGDTMESQRRSQIPSRYPCSPGVAIGSIHLLHLPIFRLLDLEERSRRHLAGQATLEKYGGLEEKDSGVPERARRVQEPCLCHNEWTGATMA